MVELGRRAKAALGLRNRSGFTLTELATVVFTLCLVAACSCSTSRPVNSNRAAVACMNNHRQLVVAWTMYADDNYGKLAFNRDGGNAGKTLSTAAWVGGWLGFSSSTDNTNVSLLIDHARWPYAAYFGPYVKSASVFKCPADRSIANVGVSGPLPRVRSVSMNNFIGQSGRTWTSPSKYSQYRSVNQIKSPPRIFVMLDERADSINDGCFMTNPDRRWNILDTPANYHDGGCTFSFADTHVEIHKWVDPRTTPALEPGKLLPLNTMLPNNADIDWLQEHASQLR